MKKVLFIYLFVISLSIYGQNKANAKVDYKVFNNTSLPNTLYATLSIEEYRTIYHEKYSTQSFNDHQTGGSVVIMPPKNLFEPFTKFDHKKKEVFFFETINAKTFLVEDNYNKLTWNVSEESKTIAGYVCLKATVNFRGREWIAWFAPDLNMPYGPWKLHGLPGLILEANDKDMIYVIRAEKINFNRDGIFDKDFNTLYVTKNDKPISYKKYLKDYQEYLENTRIEIMDERDAIMPLPTSSNMDKELVFEWNK